MATKTISITDDAYEILRSNKKENESFSQVIKRTLKKKSILDFVGIWKDMTDEEAEQIKADIKKSRANWKLRV